MAAAVNFPALAAASPSPCALQPCRRARAGLGIDPGAAAADSAALFTAATSFDGPPRRPAAATISASRLAAPAYHRAVLVVHRGMCIATAAGGSTVNWRPVRCELGFIGSGPVRRADGTPHRRRGRVSDLTLQGSPAGGVLSRFADTAAKVVGTVPPSSAAASDSGRACAWSETTTCGEVSSGRRTRALGRTWRAAAPSPSTAPCASRHPPRTRRNSPRAKGVSVIDAPGQWRWSRRRCGPPSWSWLGGDPKADVERCSPGAFAIYAEPIVHPARYRQRARLTKLLNGSAAHRQPRQAAMSRR